MSGMHLAQLENLMEVVNKHSSLNPILFYKSDLKLSICSGY